jgi:FtsP/CotA-like multicopper oxidase with cupredoxin domain
MTPIALSQACSRGASPPHQDDRRRPLPIPPLADAAAGADGTRTFRLRAAVGTTEIVAGRSTPTWGYNGSILGPTLRARDGETIAVEFENALPEATTVHWHGMHLPARCDGGPHQTVRPGDRWRPTWTVRQPAASLWYHPHPHGATEKHVYRGLAGMFLVDDDSAAGLPAAYGIDDIPLIIQDRRFTADGALDESDPTDIGLLGDTIVTNGIAGTYLPVHTERVRLRILNGSGARIYDLGFDGGQEFQIVASDGGLLAAPVTARRVQVSPGERVEIVVELRVATPISLRAFPIRNHAGVQPQEASRFGIDDAFEILELRPTPSLRTSPPVPALLCTLPAPDVSRVTSWRSFDLKWFMIDHRRMDMNRIDFHSIVDTTEIWTVRNVDNWPHNFHVHDTQFRILDVDGSSPAPELAGYKDTVYVAPGQRIQLAVRFSGYTDPTHPYMYHCHLARHEDKGMMGQFLVLASGEEPTPMGATMPMDGPDHAMR